MVLIGIIAILAAVPAGFTAELSINGCCGASSTGREGLGYAIGALIGIAGIVLIVFSQKIKKK